MPPLNFNNLQNFLSHKLHNDAGSAILEFVGFGLLLQVPLLMMAVNFAEVQQTQFAAEAIARHSLRSFVLMGTPVSEAAAEIITDFRLTTQPSLQMSCRPVGDCEIPGSTITLKVLLGKAQAQSVMRHP
ncbi:MAG: hypothetical protein RLZZ90_673 [Actinomycetota bacterium]